MAKKKISIDVELPECLDSEFLYWLSFLTDSEVLYLKNYVKGMIFSKCDCNPDRFSILEAAATNAVKNSRFGIADSSTE